MTQTIFIDKLFFVLSPDPIRTTDITHKKQSRMPAERRPSAARRPTRDFATRCKPSRCARTPPVGGAASSAGTAPEPTPTAAPGGDAARGGDRAVTFDGSKTDGATLELKRRALRSREGWCIKHVVADQTNAQVSIDLERRDARDGGRGRCAPKPEGGFSVDGDAPARANARWMTTMRRVEWMERYSLRRFRAHLASRVASATKRKG